ncbi:MAG: hypothetical protein AAF236_02990 [Verrucomicrobiota bacterium]
MKLVSQKGITLLLLSTTLAAATVSAQDFTQAFEKLVALGLPETSGAEYGKISLAGQADLGYGQDPWAHFPQLYDAKFLGNAWRLPEESEAGKFTALVSLSRLTEFTTDPESNGSASLDYVKWKPVSIDEEWAYLQKQLEDPEFLGRLGSDESLGGSLLLFACHLHHAGESDRANELSRRTLDLVTDPQSTIGNAISQVATSLFEQELDTHLKSENWGALAAALDALADRFGNGWSATPGVRALSSLAQQRSAGPMPLAAAEGVVLDEDDIQRFQRLLKLKDDTADTQLLQMLSYSGPWLLGDDLGGLTEYLPPGSKSTLLEILREGKKAIPLLISLLDNETLLPRLQPSNNSASSGSIDALLASASGRGNSSSLPRPATLSDISSQLLIPLIPGIDTYRPSSREEVKVRALTWWGEAKSFSQTELARLYFANGTSTQISAAIDQLILSGEAADFEAIEAKLIREAIESPWNDFDQIGNYVAAREEAGLAFLEKLEADIGALLEEKEQSEPDQFESLKESYDRQIAGVRSLVSTKTAAEMIAAILAGEMVVYEVYEGLLQKLAQHPYPEQVTMLGQASLEAEDPPTARTFVQLLGYLDRPEGQDPGFTDSPDIWLDLLGKTEENGEPADLATTVAWSVDSMFLETDTNGESDLSRFWSLAGDRGSALLLERARGRVEGADESTLPPYPSPDSVSESQAKTLTDELLALRDDPTALVEALDKLPLAEQLWAIDARDPSSEETSELTTAIEAAQFQIGEVNGERFEELFGKRFDLDLFDRLVETSVEKLKNGEESIIRLTRDAGFAPLSLGADLDLLDDEERARVEEQIERFDMMTRNRLSNDGAEEEAADPISYLFVDFGSGYQLLDFVGTADDRRQQWLESQREEAERFRREEMWANWLSAHLGYRTNLSFTLVGLVPKETGETEDEEAEAEFAPEF